MKNLLNEIKAMNRIAGTQLTKEQEIVIIKERLQQLQEEDFVSKHVRKHPFYKDLDKWFGKYKNKKSPRTGERAVVFELGDTGAAIILSSKSNLGEDPEKVAKDVINIAKKHKVKYEVFRNADWGDHFGRFGIRINFENPFD